MTSLDLPVAVVDLKAYDPDDYLLEEVGNCLFFFFPLQSQLSNCIDLLCSGRSRLFRVNSVFTLRDGSWLRFQGLSDQCGPGVDLK